VDFDTDVTSVGVLGHVWLVAMHEMRHVWQHSHRSERWLCDHDRCEMDALNYCYQAFNRHAERLGWGRGCAYSSHTRAWHWSESGGWRCNKCGAMQLAS
jgi:hypothetical protein